MEDTSLAHHGLEVSVETAHEVIESIYVRDPNGYVIEFTRKLRPLGDIDAVDADLTLRAAVAAEEQASQAGKKLTRIDDIWALKAALSARGSARPACASMCPRCPSSPLSCKQRAPRQVAASRKVRHIMWSRRTDPSNSTAGSSV